MMIKNNQASEAIQLITRALSTVEKSFASSPTDGVAHYRIAIAQMALGKGYSALGADNNLPQRQQLSNWLQARSWLQKAYDILKVFRDEGKLKSPEDEARFKDLDDAMANCDAAISRLTK